MVLPRRAAIRMVHFYALPYTPAYLYGTGASAGAGAGTVGGRSDRVTSAGTRVVASAFSLARSLARSLPPSSHAPYLLPSPAPPRSLD